MTLLDQLRHDWATFATSRAARNAIHHWATTTPELARYASPAEFVKAVWATNYEDANRLLSLLLAHGNCPIARRTILAGALPTYGSELALAASQARKLDATVDLDDLAATLVTELLAGIDRLVTATEPTLWPISRLHNTLDLARRRYCRRARTEPLRLPLDTDDRSHDRPAPDAGNEASGETLLRIITAAVADGRLHPADATLVARRHILGQPTTGQPVTGTTARTRQRRRQHAEAVLVAHARSANRCVA